MNVFCQGYKKIKINSSSSFQEVFSSLIGFTQTNSNDQTGPLNWVWCLLDLCTSLTALTVSLRSLQSLFYL